MRNPRATSLELTAGIGEIKCGFAVVTARVQATVKQTVTAVNLAIREALRPAPTLTGLVQDVFRSRDELLAENATQRQQPIVASRKVKQPAFRPIERGLIVAPSTTVEN